MSSARISRIRTQVLQIFEASPNEDIEAYDLDAATARLAQVTGLSGDLSDLTHKEFWGILDNCPATPDDYTEGSN